MLLITIHWTLAKAVFLFLAASWSLLLLRLSPERVRGRPSLFLTKLTFGFQVMAEINPPPLFEEIWERSMDALSKRPTLIFPEKSPWPKILRLIGNLSRGVK